MLRFSLILTGFDLPKFGRFHGIKKSCRKDVVWLSQNARQYEFLVDFFDFLMFSQERKEGDIYWLSETIKDSWSFNKNENFIKLVFNGWTPKRNNENQKCSCIWTVHLLGYTDFVSLLLFLVTSHFKQFDYNTTDPRPRPHPSFMNTFCNPTQDEEK